MVWEVCGDVSQGDGAGLMNPTVTAYSGGFRTPGVGADLAVVAATPVGPPLPSELKGGGPRAGPPCAKRNMCAEHCGKSLPHTHTFVCVCEVR